MTFFRIALLAGVLLLPAAAFAESPFNGTWKGDPKSGTITAKPDEALLKGGTYSCATCLPAYSVKADGKFHPVTDRPYWDDVAITTVDPRTVKFVLRKAGKVIGENTRTVAADGKTMTIVMTNTNNAAGAKVDQTSVMTRVGAPVPGAHLISGAWRPDTKQTEISDTGVTITMKVDGDTLRLTSPMGETLEAKFGAGYAPNVGDPGKTMTKAALLAPDKLELTDMRGGKVVQVTTYTVAADGTTIDAAWTDPRDGSRGTFKAMKQ